MGDFPWLPPYGIYILQLVRFARCCTSVLDFHYKNIQITSKLITKGYRHHKLRKHLESSLDNTPNFCQNLVIFRFKCKCQKWISHPVFYGDLVNKLRRVKSTANCIFSGSKILKHLRRRQCDPLIIERTIGIVIGPYILAYRPFFKHCSLTSKTMGTSWRAFSKPHQRQQRHDLRPLWLLVGIPSIHQTWVRFKMGGAQSPYLNVTAYILIYIFITYAVCISIFKTSPLGVAVGLLSI